MSVVKDNVTLYAWVYFFKRRSDSADSFRKCLAHVRVGVQLETRVDRSDDEAEFFW